MKNMKYLFMLVMFLFLFSDSLFARPRIICTFTLLISNKIYTIKGVDFDNDGIPDWNYHYYNGEFLKRTPAAIAKESHNRNFKLDETIKINLRNQELFIDFSNVNLNDTQKSYQFKIFDLNGIVVEEFKMYMVQGVHILNHKLPTGIYIVSIIDSENRSQFIKLFNSN